MASHWSIPAAALGLQGAINVATGIFGLVRLADFKANVSDQFGGSISSAAANLGSIQLIYMGIFTFFAASRATLHRRALIARVCVHVLAAYLFWGEGAKLQSTAKTELGFAAVNAIVILFVR